MEYRLTPNDVRLLERFQKRTILSIGTPTSKQIYEKKTLPMAFRHSFVMHTVLAMTHLHDISLTPFATPQTRASLAYHFHRGASLLHRKLSSPILPSERDALWLAASFVGIASFANVVDIACPGDAWPLRESCPSDLDWMKLSDGKKQVWRLTDPMRSSGVFRDVANELHARAMREVMVPDDVDQWECLPEGFAELYRLREDPTCANPYFAAAEALVACWGAPGSAEPESRETVAPILGFFNKLDARFRRLLEEKDDKAMLMLSYWYARVCDRRHWWMWRRAVLETRAICEYLERRWKGRWEVKLVEIPKMMAEKCDL
ncbi:hypothetical protein ColLi_03884 [Colletotrichum liriopes]|uniref:C6 zinc finger protein n=1 Tax=Colletotrichum liriopes TaxID=708192 RepID=A0AA37GHF4_9PEZI|nr:hypothetical protein ColLi_03884 [Colletotrichum liriopes]